MSKTNLIAKIIGSKTPSPAGEIRQAQQQIEQRRLEIEQRLDDVAENFQCSGQPGPARKQALLEGDPATIVAMDDEIRLLKAELKTFGPQSAELATRLEQAEKTEAAKRLPGLIKAHPGQVEAYRAALATLDAAKAAFYEHVSQIQGARRLAGDDSPALTLEQALETADLKGFHESEAELRYNGFRRQLCFDLAGQDNRPPDRTLRERKAEKANDAPRFEDEASDGHGEPDKASFWDRKEPGRAA